MPRLKDVLDAMMEDVIAARAAVDLRSVEMLEIYDEHPTLRHFSVPAFRFGKVEFELPVFASEIDELGVVQDNDDQTVGDTAGQPDFDDAALVEQLVTWMTDWARTDFEIVVSGAGVNRFRMAAQEDMARDGIERWPHQAFAQVMVATFVKSQGRTMQKRSEDALELWPPRLHEELSGLLLKPTPKQRTKPGLIVALQQGAAPGSEEELQRGDAQSVIRIVIEEDSYRIEKVAGAEPGSFRKVLVRG